MSKTFEDILSAIIETKNKQTGRKIEDSISDVYAELKLPNEKKKEMLDSCSLIDEIENITNEIKEAKREGISKEEWIMETMDNLTAGMNPTEADNVATSILDGLETAIAETNVSTTETNRMSQSNDNKTIAHEQNNTVDNIG